MKALMFILILLVPCLLFAQGDTRPANVGITVPFVAGNDTLLISSKLVSINLPVSKFVGRIALGFDFTPMNSGDGGTIDIYYKSRLSGLDWGVPYDSLGADSLHIAQVDSTQSETGDAFWIRMDSLAWWGWHDEGQLILVGGADVDSIAVKCRMRGQ